MGGAVFTGVINGRATAWMMIGMLAFAVAWEAFTNYLERRFEDNKAQSEILSKVYKELMILGFIAFSLIMGKEVGLIAWSAETLRCFEFCDLLVSICVLVYVANCATSLSVMHIAQRDWDRIAHTPTAEVIDSVQRSLDKLRASTPTWERFKTRLPYAARWHSDADFKVLQLLFQSKFHLPLSFDYVMYIKLVLEDVVVTTCNISAWHWVILMAINFIWWLGMVYLLPVLGLDPAPETDKICMYGCDGDQRRRLGATVGEPEICQAALDGDMCDMNATELQHACDALQSSTSSSNYWNQCNKCTDMLSTEVGDITSDQTLSYLVLYTGIGWAIVLAQFMIVANLRTRMKKILALHEASDPEQVSGLLRQMEENVLEHMEARRQLSAGVDDHFSLEDNEDERTDLVEHQDLHMVHLINMDAEEHEQEADHIMIFDKHGMTSNDIMSIADYELLVFLTQNNQLIMDFYFGFYFVHMAQRVSKAFGHGDIWGGDMHMQLLFHVAILSSVAAVLYLLMDTTRKISLLIGVLHLSEDAMSEVISHMDMVKSLRNRIKSGLKQGSLVRENQQPEEAQNMLQRAIAGEVALLQCLVGRDPASRIRRSEMNELVKTHKENLHVTQAELDTFLDRERYRSLTRMTKSRQATAQTAKTLSISPDEPQDNDSVELSPTLSNVQQITQSLQNVDSVTDKMFQQGLDVARAKSIFHLVDTNGDGISRNELYTVVKRFKIPITKHDIKIIFRVMDPDQSHEIDMEEWLEFMLATDQELEQTAMDASKIAQKANADKGTTMSVLLGESADVFFGDKVGESTGGLAETSQSDNEAAVPRHGTGTFERSLKASSATENVDIEEHGMANPLAGNAPEALN